MRVFRIAVQCDAAMNITAARTSGESRPNMPRAEMAPSMRWLRVWVMGKAP